jgi:hypothetical protein
MYVVPTFTRSGTGHAGCMIVERLSLRTENSGRLTIEQGDIWAPIDVAAVSEHETLADAVRAALALDRARGWKGG